MSAATIHPDFTDEIMAALLAGNTAAAKLLSQHGDCDFSKQTGNMTLLAQMILLDALFPIAMDRIDAFFAFASSHIPPPHRETLFWNCAELDGKRQHTQLTALHFAFICHEVPDAHGKIIPVEEKERILSRLLREFNEPDFLNAQVHSQASKYGGDTILHIAARQGCTGAINMLLDCQHSLGIDPNILNSHQQTPTDLCIIHYESLVNELEDQLMISGPLFIERTLARKLGEAERIVDRLLKDAKCQISTFCLVAMRLTESSFIFVHRPDTLIKVPYAKLCLLQSHVLYAADDDISQLLQLGVGRLIPFVDSPSDYGKVLSTNSRNLVQTLS